MLSFLSIAVFGSIGAAIITLLWVFIDASFEVIPSYVPVLLARWRHREVDLRALIRDPRLRHRAILFVILSGIAVGFLCSIVWIVLRALDGYWAVGSLVFVAAMWLLLFLLCNRISAAGLKWRIRSMLRPWRSDAAILLAKWPGTAGVLPHLGSYVVDRDRVILEDFQRKPSFAMREQIVWAERIANGGLYYLISSPQWLVELDFCPDDNGDSAQLRAAGFKHVRLEPCWFLYYMR